MVIWWSAICGSCYACAPIRNSVSRALLFFSFFFFNKGPTESKVLSISKHIGLLLSRTAAGGVRESNWRILRRTQMCERDVHAVSRCYAIKKGRDKWGFSPWFPSLFFYFFIHRNPTTNFPKNHRKCDSIKNLNICLSNTGGKDQIDGSYKFTIWYHPLVCE